MKKVLRALSIAAGLAVASSSAYAVVTPTHLYDLGESDGGAFVGGTINATSNDSILGGINLTRVGSPTYAAGIAPGSTLAGNFSGGVERLSSGVISTLQNNFGIEAWVTPDTTTGNRVIAYNGNSSNSGWGLYQLGGNYGGLFGGIAFVGSAPIAVGTPTHLALVRDNGTTTLYVNGKASGTSGANPNVAAGSFQIGGNFNGAENFDGVIDQVRTFSFAAGQFNRATDLSFAPKFTVVSHYRLGESDPGASAGGSGANPTIDDTALRNLNRFGTPVYTSNTPGIVSNIAMEFSGATGEHYSAGPVVTTQTDNWVLEAWVKSDTAAAGVDIIAYNGNTSNAGFGLIRNGNEWQGLYGGVAILDFNAPVVVDQWQHLALVREGGVTRLFLDGAQIGGNLANGLNVPNGSFMIGGNPLNAPESFDGMIDEVRLSLLTSGFSTKMLLLNENVPAVPEPAAATLIVIAGAALGLRRRRAA